MHASQVAFAFERAPVTLSAVDLEMVFRYAATTKLSGVCV